LYLNIALKHTTVILLLALLLLQSGGYYVIFCSDILEAKQEAMNFTGNAGKESEDLAIITFPVRDGQIIASGLIFNDEEEFTYQGRMYDVVSTEKVKDEVTFKCYTDNKETELTRNLSDKIDSDRDAPAQKHKGASLLKMPLQYTKTSQERFCFATHTSNIYSGIFHNRRQSFVYKSIVSPPPEFTLA
jgi:hypothetical protein